MSHIIQISEQGTSHSNKTANIIKPLCIHDFRNTDAFKMYPGGYSALLTFLKVSPGVFSWSWVFSVRHMDAWTCHLCGATLYGRHRIAVCTNVSWLNMNVLSTNSVVFACRPTEKTYGGPIPILRGVIFLFIVGPGTVPVIRKRHQIKKSMQHKPYQYCKPRFHWFKLPLYPPLWVNYLVASLLTKGEHWQCDLAIASNRQRITSQTPMEKGTLSPSRTSGTRCYHSANINIREIFGNTF